MIRLLRVPATQTLQVCLQSLAVTNGANGGDEKQIVARGAQVPYSMLCSMGPCNWILYSVVCPIDASVAGWAEQGQEDWHRER
jgi:hypothetical protein